MNGKQLPITNLIKFVLIAVIVSFTTLAKAESTQKLSYKTNLSEQISQIISVDVRDVTFIEMMKEICLKGDVEYGVSNDVVIDKSKKYSLSLKDVTIESAIEAFLGHTPYSYMNDNGVLLIINRPAVAATPISIAPQNKKIKIEGKVVDRGTKEGITGALVVVVGTSDGAITDEDGNFIVEVTAEDKQLEISHIGYGSTIIDIDGRTSITVEMNIAAIQLEDAVVTGIFTRKSNTYSGSVTTIKAEELERTGSLNIISALGSIDPSFSVLVNNEMGSNPNALPDIQMRGAGSFSDMKDRYTTSPNQPLFVLDGFETTLSKVMDMDMSRVESINLLKDATAKAIYGSKGANGVVVITTKTPVSGQLTVSYKGDLNIQAPVLSDYNLTNAAQKLEVERLAGVYTSSSNHPGSQANLDAQYNSILQEVLRGVDTDWLAVPTRVGVGNKHSLILEGGDDIFRYELNVGYNNIAGVMKGSERNTFEGGMNLQYKFGNLLFKNQFSYINNVGTESPYGSFSDYAKMNPYWRAYNEDGSYTTLLGEYDSLQGDEIQDIYNPAMNAVSNYLNETVYNDLTNNFYIEWQVNNDLKLTGRVGVTKYSSQADIFYPSNYATLDPDSEYNFISVTPEDGDDYFKRGLYQRNIYDKTSFSSDIVLSYSKQLGNHLIFANGQYNISTTDAQSTMYEGIGFADNATQISQARDYKENSSPTGYDDKVRELGALASINYSYDSRYLFDANYRANASSLFGVNNRWGHFWSLGAGWNVHNEKFMSNVNWINQFKLRASIGTSGKQNFAAYQALATYQYFSDDIYDNIVGAYLLAMYNPDLKWETTQDQNIGVDLTLFNSRLSITADYYIKNTDNLLTPITSVESIGFNTYIENLGKSQNTGVELRASYRLINNTQKDTYFSLNGSLAYNKNILVEINDALSSINESTSDEYQGNGNSNQDYAGVSKPRVLYEEGKSISSIWAVPSLGIDPATGQEIFVKRDGTTTYDWSADDMQALGDNLPKYQGTFGFNLDIKGFTLNAIFNYRLGGQFYNQTIADNVEKANLNYNVDVRVLTDRWNPETPGVAAKYTALERYAYYVKPTSRLIQDLNELSLTTLNIGYDFRNCKFVKESSLLERLRLSFAANELFRLATVKAERGTLYPYAKSFIFTLQATF